MGREADPPDGTQPPADPPADPPQDPPAEPTGTGTLPPEAIRNSPEFKVLEAQNRQLARQAGRDRRAAEQAREAAERARQAAEAQQQTELETELTQILGDEAGVAAYEELAELSQTDPRAYTRRLAELIAGTRAQSPAGSGEPTTPAAAAAAGEGTVPQTPPSPRGLGADAPLGQPPRTEDDNLAIAAELEKGYQAVVDRVQDPQTRRRVTMKDRAGAFIGYVGAAVLRAGARPSEK